MLARMPLEYWDDRKKKYVLYVSSQQHSLDCERFPFNHIPCRVFLDTNVINCLVKWRSQIFEREPIPPNTEETLALDIEALMHVFHVGSRADWDLVGSPKTLDELSRTRNPDLRDDLLDYGIQIVDHLPKTDDRQLTFEFAHHLFDSPSVIALPDIADRELIGNAITLECDAFCTCDRSTIVSKRNKLHRLPLRILTPAEWWSHVKPWAGLWG